MSRDRLKAALHPTRPQLDQPKPESNWELFAEHRLVEIEETLKSIRNRIDTLLWSIAAAIALGAVSMIVRNL